MNTASRMESTGVNNQIQISQETADQLIARGKSHWCEPRQETVEAKGKGELSTYFLNEGQIMRRTDRATSFSDTGSVVSNSTTSNSGLTSAADSREDRLAGWTIEVLSGLLKEIEIRRRATNTRGDSKSKLAKLEGQSLVEAKKGSTVIDEVKEIVELPNFDVNAARKETTLKEKGTELPTHVQSELSSYVRKIASMYMNNRKFF